MVLMVVLVLFGASLLTTEVNWDLMDYIILIGLLLFVFISYEFLIKKSKYYEYKVGSILAIVGFACLFWINDAVGVIKNESLNANKSYIITFLFVISGAVIFKFSSKGMAMTMWIAFIIQLLLPIILCAVSPVIINDNSGILDGLLLNSILAILFALSGIFYYRTYAKEISLV